MTSVEVPPSQIALVDYHHLPLTTIFQDVIYTLSPLLRDNYIDHRMRAHISKCSFRLPRRQASLVANNQLILSL
jgi:hypothetical protein